MEVWKMMFLFNGVVLGSMLIFRGVSPSVDAWPRHWHISQKMFRFNTCSLEQCNQQLKEHQQPALVSLLKLLVMDWEGLVQCLEQFQEEALALELLHQICQQDQDLDWEEVLLESKTRMWERLVKELQDTEPEEAASQSNNPYASSGAVPRPGQTGAPSSSIKPQAGKPNLDVYAVGEFPPPAACNVVC